MNTQKKILIYTFCLLAGAGIFALILQTAGISWPATSSAFIDGSFLEPGRWGETLTYMLPLALVALGAIFSFRAGYINIGQEGQLIIGGAAAAYVAAHLNAPGPVVLVLLLAAGAVAGALWAGMAAFLKFWRAVPEVLTTLLSITLAFQLTGYGLKTTALIANPDPPTGGRSLGSEPLPASSRLGEFEIFGNEISVGIFLVIGLAVLTWLIMEKTVAGFRLQTLGQNPGIVARAGISKELYGTGAMLFSGGLAGLAGAVILASGITSYTFLPGFSLNFGWTGLLVALIARNKAWLTIVVASLFAGFYTGAQFLASTGVNRQVGDVATAIFVLAFLIPPALIYFFQRQGRLLGAGG